MAFSKTFAIPKKFCEDFIKYTEGGKDGEAPYFKSECFEILGKKFCIKCQAHPHKNACKHLGVYLEMCDSLEEYDSFFVDFWIVMRNFSKRDNNIFKKYCDADWGTPRVISLTELKSAMENGEALDATVIINEAKLIRIIDHLRKTFELIKK